MRLIVSFIFLNICFGSIAQELSKIKHCFKPDEKLKYIASYSIKGIMTELAGIEMEVLNVEGKKKPIYQLIFTTNTLLSWDDYVKVRHSYQTYVEASSLKPLIMVQDSDIKGHTTKAKYTFKHKVNKAEMEVNKNNSATINKSIDIRKNTFDIVSMLYHIRTIDYDNFNVNDKTPLSILFLENIVAFNLKYLGKEKVNNEAKGDIFCYKIAIELERKFIVEPNVSYIWISADDDKTPVQISTIFKEGNAIVKLIQ